MYIDYEKSALDPELLRNFSFFESFSMDELEGIAERAQKTILKADTVVFHQGDYSTAMFLVLKGTVKIEYRDEKQEVFSVSRLCEDQVFGELAILSKEPCQVTATTIEETELLAIDRPLILDIIRKSDPEEILGFFSLLSEQTRKANDREVEDLLSRRTLEAQMEAEKQRALTQMVAGVAHEINNPLNNINAAVSIMARELAMPKEVTIQRAADIAESLELMRRNVERAHGLVQDFKKVSVSYLIDTSELVNISEVVEETIGLIVVSLRRSQIQVDFKNKLTTEQIKWVGNRGFLSQVLINLLTNVERYAYPLGTGGVVDVTMQLDDDDQYRLIVKDHGRGISTEDQARVFEPFFTTGRKVGGTGLGLAIVRNLVTNALKGEIELNSTEGKGTEFVVTFPRVI